MKHLVKFEIYKKYIQVEVTSNTKEEAVKKVRDRLNIISVEKVESDFERIKNFLGL